ncbi:MAG: hypothetical protein J7L42_05620 [Elusimicrobia bacterium]|nr:hypothetical protein [Elusimicrobiota bacterium]
MEKMNYLILKAPDKIGAIKSSWFWRQGRSREMARSPSAADWGKVPRSQSPACQKPLTM